MNEHQLAPIVLFVYNRPAHTRQTLAALSGNKFASESEIYIYSDGPKNKESIQAVAAVRAVIHEPWPFRQIHYIERQQNMGLAASVIEGVSTVIKKHKHVIVFEDDLQSAPYALQYFNAALRHYHDEQKVMHISAYNYPLKELEQLPESFFFRVANSWGWATWERAWQHFNPAINELLCSNEREHYYHRCQWSNRDGIGGGFKREIWSTKCRYF